MTPQTPTAPPERFNFAQHLIERNATRGAKAAYIDDAETLTYAALADRAITSAHVYGSRTGQRFRTQRNSINGTVLVMLLGAAPPRGTPAQGELELSDSED